MQCGIVIKPITRSTAERRDVLRRIAMAMHGVGLAENRAWSGARFSECRTWRYSLWRMWGDGPPMAVIGLNPSTADEARNDPTVRRCIDFARRDGYGGLVMLNIFAFRATDPNKMKSAIDPIGPENDREIIRMAEACGITVLACGVHGAFMGRLNSVVDLLRDKPVYCFGVTKGGYPRHPLYLAKTTKIEVYHGAK